MNYFNQDQKVSQGGASAALSSDLAADQEVQIARLQALLGRNRLDTSLGYLCFIKDTDLWRLESDTTAAGKGQTSDYFRSLMSFAPLVESSESLSHEDRCHWLRLALAYDHIVSRKSLHVEILTAYQRGQDLGHRYHRVHPSSDAADKWSELALSCLAEAETGLFCALRIPDEATEAGRLILIQAAQQAFREAEPKIDMLSPFERCYVRWTERVARQIISESSGCAPGHLGFASDIKDILDDLRALKLDSDDALVMRRSLEASLAESLTHMLLLAPSDYSRETVRGWVGSVRGTLEACKMLLNMPDPLAGGAAGAEMCADEVFLRTALAQWHVFLGEWGNAEAEAAIVDDFVISHLSPPEHSTPDWVPEEEEDDDDDYPDEEPGSLPDGRPEEEEEDEDLIPPRIRCVQSIASLVNGENLYQVETRLRDFVRGDQPLDYEQDWKGAAEVRRCVCSILNMAGWGAKAHDPEAFELLGKLAGPYRDSFKELCPVSTKWVWDKRG